MAGLKLYYQHGFNRPRMVALHEAMLAEGIESPYAERLEEWKPDPRTTPGSPPRWPCGEYFAIRDQALIAHATQIDPDGFLFQVPLELQQRVWPTEDFELVRADVETGCPRTTCSRVSAVAKIWRPETRPHERADGPRTTPGGLGGQGPEAPNDVKAGWVAFAVFIGSRARRGLPRVQPHQAPAQGRENAERGVFDPSDKPANERTPTAP